MKPGSVYGLVAYTVEVAQLSMWSRLAPAVAQCQQDVLHVYRIYYTTQDRFQEVHKYDMTDTLLHLK